MKICMITAAQFPPREGIGSYITGLSKELIKKGHEITVLTRGGLHKVKKREIDGIEIHDVPFIPLYPFHADIHRLFLSSSLDSLQSKPDIIHYHSALVPYIPRKIPTITTVHSPIRFAVPRMEVVDANSLGAKIFLPYFTHAIERRLILSSNIIATVSQRTREDLIRLGFPEEKIIRVGNGVDTILFRPSGEPRIRGSILYVGRLDYGKGLWDLVKAFRIVQGSRPDSKLVFIGDGAIREKLEAGVKDLIDNGKVEFLGRLPRIEIAKYYQSCNLMVMPSLYEGLPTVILEAMASSCPVVSTDVGGCSEVIEHGVNGLIAPASNPDMLVNEMLRIMNDASLATIIGNRARETIVEHYSWPIIADRYEKIYQSLLENRN